MVVSPTAVDPAVAAATAAADRAVAELATPRVPRTSEQIDPDLFARVDRLNELRRELDRLSRAIKVEADAEEAELVSEFAQAGIAQIAFGTRAGTLGRTLWAQKVDESVTGEQVAAALRADGYDMLVTPEGYHNGQLSAWLRRREESGLPIPPHLAKVITACEVFGIGFTTRRPTAAQTAMTQESSVLGCARALPGGASSD